MVLERLISPLLNTFLRDYVETVDRKELSIEFGGNVELNNLRIKQSALDKLNLPVQVKACRIEKLSISIPYLTLWTSPSKAEIKGVHLLVIPNKDTVYNENDEKEANKRNKQKELAAIEGDFLSRRSREKDGSNQDDGFINKLILQIIKNLLVTIEDVHIRYEDAVTTPNRPFVTGVTIKKIALQTTDNLWKVQQVWDASKLLYKLLTVDDLAVYWLSNSPELFHKMPVKEHLKRFPALIASNSHRPYNDFYLVGPITCSARVMTNMNSSGTNSKSPKIILKFLLNEVPLSITLDQYQDIIACLSQMDYTTRAAPYRKHRQIISSTQQGTSSRKNYKNWWRFAITCVLEDVKQRRRNWTWSHIKEHLKCVKQYISLYTKKLSSKEDKSLTESLAYLEDRLDVFNIVLARRKAELLVTKAEQKKAKDKQNAGGGLFGKLYGLFVPSEKSVRGIVENVRKEMTPQEKQELFNAIGHDEHAPATTSEREFVDKHFGLELKRLRIFLRNSSSGLAILDTSLEQVEASVDQRPTAKALKASVRVSKFSVHGTQEHSEVATIIRQLEGTSSSDFLKLTFETNQAERRHQLLHLTVEPLLITYDSKTIERVASMFASNETTTLAQIRATARQKLESLKKTSSLALEHAIRTHAVLDVDINIKGSLLLLPGKSRDEAEKRKILCKMGNLQILSQETRGAVEKTADVSEMFKRGCGEQEINLEMQKLCYDKFTVDLTDLKIISVFPDEDWSALLASDREDIYLLKPTNFALALERCLISDDISLPKLKVQGKLPALDVNIVDTRLINAVAVLMSHSSQAKDPGTETASGKGSKLVNTVDKDCKVLLKAITKKKERENADRGVGQRDQGTDLAVLFDIQLIRLRVSMTKDNATVTPIANFTMNNFEASYVKKTLTQVVDLKLRDVYLGYVDSSEKRIRTVALISTKKDKAANVKQSESFFVTVHYIKNDEPAYSPAELKENNANILSKVEVDVGALVATFQHEAIMGLFQFNCYMQSEIDKVSKRVDSPKAQTPDLKVPAPKIPAPKGKRKKKQHGEEEAEEDISAQCRIQVKSLQLNLENKARRLSQITVGGLYVKASMRASRTELQTNLQTLFIVDPSVKTLYHDIVSPASDQVFQLQVVQYKKTTAEANTPDLVVTFVMSPLNIVFLNCFVKDVLLYVSKLQQAKLAVSGAPSAIPTDVKEQAQVDAPPTRIHLDVRVRGPLIVIPQSSNSREAIVVSFDNMAMENNIETRNATNATGSPAVMDSIAIQIKNFYVNVAALNDLQVEFSRRILNLPSLTIGLLRNLTSTWYVNEPNLSVNVQISETNVTLSQLAFLKALQILPQNLNESTEDPQQLPTSQINQESANKEIIEPQTTESPPNVIQQEPPRTKFSFIVSLTKLSVELNTNTTVSLDVLYDTTSERPLALLTLQGLASSSYIMSDQSIQVELSLQGLFLEDTRIGDQVTDLSLSGPSKMERRIVKLLYPSTCLDVSSADNMLVIRYDKDKEKNSKIELYVSGFTLFACPSYLLCLLGFFRTSQSKHKESPASKSDDAAEVVENQQAVEPHAKPASKNTVRTTICVQIDKSEVNLVEQLAPSNTSAIVIRFQLLTNILLLAESQEISAELKALHIFSCHLDTRKEAIATILNPTNLNAKVKFVRDVLKAVSFINLQMDTVSLNISPGTLALLGSFSKAISTAGQSKSKVNDVAEEPEPTILWSGLWEAKPLENFKFPSLQATPSTADEIASKKASTSKQILELLMFTCNSLNVFIETGQGSYTTPLILLEASLKATVKNWSQALDVSTLLTLEAGYYNSKMALWEPLIEPVDLTTLGIGKNRPWEMTVTVSKKQNEEGLASKLEIKLESNDTLEVTVTKTFLDVVSVLLQGFSEAANRTLPKQAARYIVHNRLDESVLLDFVPGDFLPDNALAVDGEMIIERNAEVGLKLKQSDRLNRLLDYSDDVKEHSISIRFPESSYQRDIPLDRSVLRYLPAGKKHTNTANVGYVVDVSNEFGLRSVTLRSVVQVHNHLPMPMNVYRPPAIRNEFVFIGQIEAGATFRVPPSALYTVTEKLLFAPAGYLPTVGLVWRDLKHQESSSHVFKCVRKSTQVDLFFVKVDVDVKQILYENTNKKASNSLCYDIHLRPTVMLHNSLPIPLFLTVDGTTEEICVQSCDSVVLPTVKPGSSSIVFKLKNFNAKDWTCKQSIESAPKELAVWEFSSNDATTLDSRMDFGVLSIIKDSTLNLNVYCPFWMINNTGCNLTYKGEHDNTLVYHSKNVQGPVLFSYSPKLFFKKKSALVRIESGEWSEAFTIEAAGSSGVVTCKSKDACYQLGVAVELGKGGLTKLVVFTPYHILSNVADYDVEVCEVTEAAGGQRNWITIHSKQSIPFWPRGSKKLLVFRVAGTCEETLPLSWENTRRTLLRLDNSFGGIDVDFKVSDSSIAIVCHPYEEGRAPFLLVNHTDHSITLKETDGSESFETVLAAHHACYYTWKQPNGPRNFSFCVEGIEMKDFTRNDILRSCNGEIESKTGAIRWTSFVHDHQRVLMFANAIHVERVHGSSEKRIEVLIHGIGLSIVDNANRREILYAAISSSGVVWEMAKADATKCIYRAVDDGESKLLEEAYQHHTRRMAAFNAAEDKIVLSNEWIVDFSHMSGTRKSKRQILRRTCRYGCKLSFTDRGNSRLLHVTLHKLQIDNKLDDCVFPVVFAPVPPPRSLTTESISNPFVELSVVELSSQQSGVKQYEYLKLLIQEFQVELDMSLVIAMGAFLAKGSQRVDSKKQHQTNSELNVKSAMKGLNERTRLFEQKSPEHYFKMLHLSPLKIRLSFSSTGGDISSLHASDSQTALMLSLILHSVGISITEVQDVVFRLEFFERNGAFLSWKQLTRDLTWHYTQQAIKQMYVLVLGLDVIGNPFEMISGIGEGVEKFFYEPFQGAIQGPDEFVEGLALGTRSLLSNTFGGMAGAASKITGTIGKGLSYLTFDEDYQKRRRENMHRRTSDLGENLAQGGEALLTDMAAGVSGIVTQPIEGAQRHGVRGFFVGVAKGIAGLFLRPAAAMVDFASGSLDAMKKATDVNKDVVHLRPTRPLHPEGIVRPYVRYEAVGRRLLRHLDKGHVAITDHYVDHVPTTNKGVLLVTNRQIILVKKRYEIKWAHTWEELAGPPILNRNGLYIPVRDQNKRSEILLGQEIGKQVNIQAREKCAVLKRKIEALLKN